MDQANVKKKKSRKVERAPDQEGMSGRDLDDIQTLNTHRSQKKLIHCLLIAHINTVEGEVNNSG